MRPDSDAALKPETGQVSPFVAGVAASMTALGLVAIAAVTGVLPSALTHKPADASGAAAAPTLVFNPVPADGCAICGTVEAIRSVEVRVADLADGPADALPGRESGAAVTLLGAGSGAAAGSTNEKNDGKRLMYRVTVHMNDGSYRTISISNPPGFTIGDRVRVVAGRLVNA